MRYKYFVSYNYADKSGLSGFGSAELTWYQKINRRNTLEDMRFLLKIDLMESEKRLIDPQLVILNCVFLKRVYGKK